MKLWTAVPILCLLATTLSSCKDRQVPAEGETPAPSSPALFSEAQADHASPSEPHVIRSRFVKVNLATLLDGDSQVCLLEPNAEVTFNLFPDVAYVGIVQQMEQNGDVCSWAGTLKGVEFSEFFMVYTAGVFMAHIASPGGVYEVSSAGGDLYRVVMIDQTRLNGED